MKRTENTNRKKRALFGLAVPAVLATAMPLFGMPIQDEGDAPTEKKTIREMVQTPQLPTDGAEDRMKKLFAKVELRLREIDELLSDASAGDTAKLNEVGEAGIDELLRASLQQGRQLQKEIEEIVAITPP